MGVIAFLVRAEARRRWRTLLVLALLLGVVGGTSIAAAAGARRTGSAYERLLRATSAEDVLVNPDDGFADFDAIEALPQVVRACRAAGAPAALAGPDGEPDFTTPYLPFVSDGHCMVDLSGPARVRGRLPDPTAPHETFLSQPLADDLGAGPGDTLPFLVYTDEQSPPEQVELTVTGTGVYGADALLDPANDATFPVMVLTPAFRERHPFDPEQTFTGSLVQLRRGERDLAAFNAAAVDAAGESLHLEDRWGNERKAARSLEPYSLALWLFAVGVVVAGGGMVLGVLHRTLATARAEQRTLASLGVPPGARGAVPLVLAALVGAVAAATASALAVALSPLSPIGPARDIEPHPGTAADTSVLLVGAIAVLLAAGAVGALVSMELRRAEAQGRAGRMGIVSRVTGWLPVTAAAGARLSAGELGGGRSAARGTALGAALGVVAIITVQLVGSGIGRVVDTPARYGWSWDAMLTVSEATLSDYRPDGGPVLRDALGQLDEMGITDHTTISLGQVDVGGEAVAAVGIGTSTGSPLTPPIVSGRAPSADDELVVGANTLERLGASVGDLTTVSFGSSRRTMRIVGQATFPRLTEYPGAPNTGLGEGAMLRSSALSELTGALPYTSILVEASDAAARRALRDAFSTAPSLDSEAEISLVERPQRPDALYGYESTSEVRQALAYLLGGLTVASVSLGLVAASRAARRELAVLRTVGLTRGQIRSVVHLHGAVVGAVAVCAGVPLGLASGRAAWRAFATHLGVTTDPITPLTAVVSTGGLVVVVCLALTLPVAFAAIRHQPATVLRAE